MLLKSLEFKTNNGQKVKIIDIPVLEEDSSYRFMITIRLESFIRTIDKEVRPKNVYSFKEYLKKILKWPDYEAIYQPQILQHNA
ncbi:DUF2535 family protein [Bacillus kexueae]|uniref:DUF2535 family protein n=1 Tax=Aeribacillus kexueae TaxID=2078952 RepID=UPI001FB045F9|nr:DUF2535 family protein [Bacillus kexueae]